MKSEKLLRAIGEIDDRLVEEADVQAAVNTVAANAGRRNRRRGFAAIAASIAVVVIAGVLAVNGDLDMPKRTNDTMPYTQPDSNTSAIDITPSDRNTIDMNTSDNAGSVPKGTDSHATDKTNSEISVSPSDSAAEAPGRLSPEIEQNESIAPRQYHNNEAPKPSSPAFLYPTDGDARLPASLRRVRYLGFPGLIWQMWLSGAWPIK